MAGFPSSQLDRYLRQLVLDLKVTVAIVDQFERPENSDGSDYMKFDRRISRIVTPGTLIDESFINWEQNNYLAAVAVADGANPQNATEHTEVGLAWINLGLGTCSFQSSKMKDLSMDLARIQPSEVLVPKTLANTEWVSNLYYVNNSTESKSTNIFDLFESIEDLNLESHERAALESVLSYVKNHLPEWKSMKIQAPERLEVSDFLKIDERSRAALELTKSLVDGTTKGTLLRSIKRTITESGTRLLTEWVKKPLVRREEIEKRLDIVEELSDDARLIISLSNAFGKIGDPMRLIQKFGLGKSNARDLVMIGLDLEVMEQIRDIILELENNAGKPTKVGTLVKEIDPCKALRKSISSKINEEILFTISNNNEDVIEPTSVAESENIDWVIKPSASVPLKRLHSELAQAKKEEDKLIDSLKKKYSGYKLDLKWSPGLGHHGHLSGKVNELNDSTLLANILTRHKKTMSFRIPEWTELGVKTELIRNKMQLEEKKVLDRLQASIIAHKATIRKNCNIIDQLDVLISFAQLRMERELVRPVLTDDKHTVIKDGRHPSVELGLALNGRVDNFIANDCDIGVESESVWVITGPNMGGKSTFLRQIALITILGQIGSFVPASYAKLGIVDQIFCRVGAGDDLYHDKSTFMVEMLETTNILRNATDRSLAILDEVGRGTSGHDGLAIAYAVVMHLLQINKSRSLFATHFGPELHELLSDENPNGKIGYYCTDLDFVNDNSSNSETFAFNHRLRKGVAEDSHGLRIARMAGFPAEAVQMAEDSVVRLGARRGMGVLGSEKL